VKAAAMFNKASQGEACRFAARICKLSAKALNPAHQPIRSACEARFVRKASRAPIPPNRTTW
jgi:hypothetical protein